MQKLKVVLLVIMLLVMTGCTKITDNLDEVVNATLTKENIKVNTVSTGYELYIPDGVEQLSDNEYNQKFKIKDRHVYLYVDTISYYYKNALNYKKIEDYNHYYKELQFNGKSGYIGVNKIEDENYFCEVVYNYTKIEFYSDIDNLPVILANSLIIQNSIKFNDNLISLELESSINDGREITYELDKPKDSQSTFDKYLQESVTEEPEEVELPDDN